MNIDLIKSVTKINPKDYTNEVKLFIENLNFLEKSLPNNFFNNYFSIDISFDYPSNDYALRYVRSIEINEIVGDFTCAISFNKNGKYEILNMQIENNYATFHFESDYIIKLLQIINNIMFSYCNYCESKRLIEDEFSKKFDIYCQEEAIN